MHTARVLLSVLCGMLCVCGCKREGSTSDSSAQMPLADRLKSASCISDPSKRDDAYTHLAKDAADAGDAAVAIQSAQAIGDPATRDSAEATASLRLGKAGKGDSVKLAQMISDPSKRDKILAKLTAGDFSE